MKKSLAVVLLALMVVSVPVAYAAAESFVGYCDSCGHETSMETEYRMYSTWYDDEYHLISFYWVTTCIECGEDTHVWDTDSLEAHTFNDIGVCINCID